MAEERKQNLSETDRRSYYNQGMGRRICRW